MLNDEARDQTTDVPLILDIDGTLLRTDLLFETIWAALRLNVLATLVVLVTSLFSPAQLKRRLIKIAEPDIELMPVRQSVLQRAHAAIGQGRAVHLASGADQSQVDAVAQRFALPGPHFGSNDPLNLTGTAKADFLVARFGDKRFDYAGNAWVDLKIWQHARKLVAVAPPGRLAKRLKQLGQPVCIEPETFSLKTALREMRPHHWIKNLLFLVPLVADHNLGLTGITQVVVAMIAFSLGASALYIINDLLDLDADRRHPEKRNRPIASGALSIQSAMIICLGLMIAAPLLAWAVSPAVAALTVTYMLSSLIYSLWLKKLRWFDLLMLAWMFLLRVVTGAVASGIEASKLQYLLAFVFAVSLALAATKRITALARARHHGYLPGRGYRETHMTALQWISILSAASALAVFLAYALGPTAATLYASPRLLALAAIPLFLWFFRIIRLSELGKEDYDPTVFVTHDKIGLALVAIGIALALLAI